MAYDIYWDKVVLGMHMDDTGLTDVKGHTVTLNGGAARSATQSKFGGYSANFNGTNSNLVVTGNADFNLSSVDWTVEAFVYRTASGVTQGIINLVATAGANSGLSFYVNASNQLAQDNGVSATTAAGTVPLNQWVHVAACRSSGNTQLFIDGSPVGSPITQAPNTATFAYIGSVSNTSNPYWFTGYIDDLRVTKGVARYTSSFTVPNAAFAERRPSVSGVVRDANNNLAERLVRVHDRNMGRLLAQAPSNPTTGAYSIDLSTDKEVYAIAYSATSYDQYWDKVVLAMHMDDTGLTDLIGHTVVLNSGATRSSTKSKFGGYSAYLPGSGGNITITHATDFSFGSGDFTIEFFYCPQAVTAYSAILALDDPDYPFCLYHGSSVNSGNPMLAIGPSSSAWFTSASAISFGAVTNGTWYHMAITRSGDTFRVFKDGALISSGTTDSAGQAVGSATTLSLGRNGTYYTQCYIDDLLIYKGFAKYTAAFTAPTAAFIDGVVGGTENAVILDRLVPV